MAFDTQEKRMNVARVGRPWMRARFPVGAFDEQARIESGHGYGGNALVPPVPGSGGMSHQMTFGILNDINLVMNNPILGGM